MSQLGLWPEAAPSVSNSSTSQAAAREAAGFADTIAARVLAFVQGRGSYGATDAEIQTGLSLRGDSERPRRVFLVRSGQIQDSGRVRPTASGRMARVFVSIAGGNF